MSTATPVTKAAILEMVKALSPEERSELMDELEESISPVPDGVTPEEFRAELDRRWAEYKSGKVRMMTWDEVKAMARSQWSANG